MTTRNDSINDDDNEVTPREDLVQSADDALVECVLCPELVPMSAVYEHMQSCLSSYKRQEQRSIISSDTFRPNSAQQPPPRTVLPVHTPTPIADLYAGDWRDQYTLPVAKQRKKEQTSSSSSSSATHEQQQQQPPKAASIPTNVSEPTVVEVPPVVGAPEEAESTAEVLVGNDNIIIGSNDSSAMDLSQFDSDIEEDDALLATLLDKNVAAIEQGTNINTQLGVTGEANDTSNVNHGRNPEQDGNARWNLEGPPTMVETLDDYLQSIEEDCEPINLKNIPLFKHIPFAGPLIFVDSFQRREVMIKQYNTLASMFFEPFSDDTSTIGLENHKHMKIYGTDDIHCGCYDPNTMNSSEPGEELIPPSKRAVLTCFLSHFHSDHYERVNGSFGVFSNQKGSKRKERQPNGDRIICTLMTRNLLLQKFNINPRVVIGVNTGRWFQLTKCCFSTVGEANNTLGYIPTTCLRPVSNEEYHQIMIKFGEDKSSLLLSSYDAKNKIMWQKLLAGAVGAKHVIKGIRYILLDRSVFVKLLDSNHCPGAAMFVFDILLTIRTEAMDGSLALLFGDQSQICRKRIRMLHCGDFRATGKVTEAIVADAVDCIYPKTQQSILYALPFDRIYIDNTYADSLRSFPPQDVVFKQGRDLVNCFLQDNMSSVSIQEAFENKRKTRRMSYQKECTDATSSQSESGTQHLQKSRQMSMSSFLSGRANDHTDVKVSNPLIIIGSYLIGKERLILDLIKFLETSYPSLRQDGGIKIFCIDPVKRECLSVLTPDQLIDTNCFKWTDDRKDSTNSKYEFASIRDRLTDNPKRALIHVYKLHEISRRGVVDYVQLVAAYYYRNYLPSIGVTDFASNSWQPNNMLAIKPTGWSGGLVGVESERYRFEFDKKILTSIKESKKLDIPNDESIAAAIARCLPEAVYSLASDDDLRVVMETLSLETIKLLDFSVGCGLTTNDDEILGGTECLSATRALATHIECLNSTLNDNTFTLGEYVADRASIESTTSCSTYSTSMEQGSSVKTELSELEQVRMNTASSRPCRIVGKKIVLDYSEHSSLPELVRFLYRMQIIFAWLDTKPTWEERLNPSPDFIRSKFIKFFKGDIHCIYRLDVVETVARKTMDPVLKVIDKKIKSFAESKEWPFIGSVVHSYLSSEFFVYYNTFNLLPMVLIRSWDWNRISSVVLLQETIFRNSADVIKLLGGTPTESNEWTLAKPDTTTLPTIQSAVNIFCPKLAYKNTRLIDVVCKILSGYPILKT